jgi:hypothetical protein
MGHGLILKIYLTGYRKNSGNSGKHAMSGKGWSVFGLGGAPLPLLSSRLRGMTGRFHCPLVGEWLGARASGFIETKEISTLFFYVI